MTFLYPALLAGLVLTALPIVIHLINQLRYRTIRWGAMMFLLQANRMSRGLARLRQWLILLMRMLAIACLVLVVSRPLGMGVLGWLTAGHADTTIILLDRSPSMLASSGGRSKLAASRRQLAETLGRFSSSRWVLIESGTLKPHELESPAALEQLPEAGPTSAATDLPSMLAAARNYIVANQAGRTEVWICSDLHSNDWASEDARWNELRSSFAGLPQPVRFHLLAYAEPPGGDVAVRVSDLRARRQGESAELVVSLRLSRQGGGDPVSVPVQFDIGGARSTLNVELVGTSVEVREHRIGLDGRHLRGWGRVSIPADANLADNEFYFTFDASQSPHTVVVSDEREVAEPLQLMASIGPDPNEPRTADVVSLQQSGDVEWAKAALVLWQAPLPEGQVARQLTELVDRGGEVIFFPPRQISDEPAFGLRWKSWSPVPDGAVIDRWRGDEGLLADTQSGMPLPVGKLDLKNICSLVGEATPLATLKGGDPIVARAEMAHGGVYFWATTPAPQDSNLGNEGVVLYVAIQRALAAGSAALGHARQLVAAGFTADGREERAAKWQKLAGSDSALSSEYALQAGAYLDGDLLLAVNRPEEEDTAGMLVDEKVSQLFEGLDFTRIDQVASRDRSLVEELWRPCLIAMLIVLLAEAVLCLPRPAAENARERSRGFAFGR
ncbi:MAG TPA: BatA and WFA domain-containing protein [Pirellulales bacterium]|nr:BatA and WFA domain-containing protein [Pirellulales bacterium]